MDDRLYEVLEKLPRKNLIHLMWEALDYMSQWNGRSRQECILMGMGAEPKTNEKGRTSYRVQSLAEVKRNTESMGL